MLEQQKTGDMADEMEEEGTALVFLREMGHTTAKYVRHFDYETLHQNIHAKSGQLVGTVILEIKFH